MFSFLWALIVGGIIGAIAGAILGKRRARWHYWKYYRGLFRKLGSITLVAFFRDQSSAGFQLSQRC